MEKAIPNRNLFFGDSLKTKFALLIYEKLKSRDWFTYADIIRSFNSRYPDEARGVSSRTVTAVSFNSRYRDEARGVSSRTVTAVSVKNDVFGKEPMKAMKAVQSLLDHPDDIVSEGNNRNRRYRYVGAADDPLAELLHARVIDNLKDYCQFCMASAGFFPPSWLEYFLKDTTDLLDIKMRKTSGRQVLFSSADRLLTNIELLPLLYKAIVDEKSLKLTYHPIDMPARELIFHPHILKEYNGRWHLLGHAEGEEPEWGYDLALDRIEGKPQPLYMPKYIPAQPGFYDNLFKDSVGVSHPRDGMVYDIRLRAHSKYMFWLTDTKKIHASQTVAVPYGSHDNGEYGEFALHVKVNPEFIGRILQMGDGLEVMSPPVIRQLFRERTMSLARRYGQHLPDDKE